jgi:hypothetical protein
MCQKGYEMNKITKIILVGLVLLLTGCGGDDGKLSGIWEGESQTGRWTYRYQISQTDDGYKAIFQEKFKDSQEFKNKSEIFLKKSGSYLSTVQDPHFIEILNDHELKVVNSGTIFKQIDSGNK